MGVFDDQDEETESQPSRGDCGLVTLDQPSEITGRQLRSSKQTTKSCSEPAKRFKVSHLRGLVEPSKRELFLLSEENDWDNGEEDDWTDDEWGEDEGWGEDEDW